MSNPPGPPRPPSMPTDLVIPPRPQVVEGLIAERRKDDPDFHRIESLISRDVGLAAAILKTANSPAFGASRTLTNIGQAMQMIGLASVINIACGLALRHMMKNSASVSLERFWDTSENVAIQCASLAARFKTIGRDDAYTFGLFHDTGIAVLLQRFPAYKDALRQANARAGRLFVDIEDELMGTNHAVVGALLARNWGLPDDIVEAVHRHHDLDFFLAPTAGDRPTTRNLIALVHLAEHLHHLAHRASEDVEWDTFGAAVLAHFEIEPADYQDLLSEYAGA